MIVLVWVYTATTNLARRATHGKNDVILGAHEQTHQTCRQTDDYLHDKDLKYST